VSWFNVGRLEVFVKGFSSATWIIEKVEVFALAAGDPFSADGVHMLRQSGQFFNDLNGAVFFES
jgi:hypothetical protein